MKGELDKSVGLFTDAYDQPAEEKHAANAHDDDAAEKQRPCATPEWGERSG
jgi:hypothetical protein